jgi:DNA anti-recombination protein RmuC
LQAQAAFFSPNAPNPNASNGVTKEQLLEALQPVNEKINEQTNNIKEQTEKLKEQTEKLNQLCNTVAKLDKDLEVKPVTISVDMHASCVV